MGAERPGVNFQESRSASRFQQVYASVAASLRARTRWVGSPRATLCQVHETHRAMVLEPSQQRPGAVVVVAVELVPVGREDDLALPLPEQVVLPYRAPVAITTARASALAFSYSSSRVRCTSGVTQWGDVTLSADDDSPGGRALPDASRRERNADLEST